MATLNLTWNRDGPILGLPPTMRYATYHSDNDTGYVSIQFDLSSGELVIGWTGGVLESSDTVLGPWNPAPADTNPYRTPPEKAEGFFRVRRP